MGTTSLFNPATRRNHFNRATYTPQPFRAPRLLARNDYIYADDSPACQTTQEKTISGCPLSCCCPPWQWQMMPSSTFLRTCSVLRLSYGKDGASEIRFGSSVEAFASSADRSEK